MAKKQTRRSISVSRATYERLKAFCETNTTWMSQLVETRVNDFLGHDLAVPEHRVAERPADRSFERPVERPIERTIERTIERPSGFDRSAAPSATSSMSAMAR